MYILIKTGSGQDPTAGRILWKNATWNFSI